MTTKFPVGKQVSPIPMGSNQNKYQNPQHQCDAERHTVAAISNGSTRLNIWVKINK